MRKLLTFMNVIIKARLKSVGPGPGITLKLSNLNFPYRTEMNDDPCYKDQLEKQVLFNISATRSVSNWQLNWIMK